MENPPFRLSHVQGNAEQQPRMLFSGWITCAVHVLSLHQFACVVRAFLNDCLMIQQVMLDGAFAGALGYVFKSF